MERAARAAPVFGRQSSKRSIAGSGPGFVSRRKCTRLALWLGLDAAEIQNNNSLGTYQGTSLHLALLRKPGGMQSGLPDPLRATIRFSSCFENLSRHFCSQPINRSNPPSPILPPAGEKERIGGLMDYSSLNNCVAGLAVGLLSPYPSPPSEEWGTSAVAYGYTSI